MVAGFDRYAEPAIAFTILDERLTTQVREHKAVDQYLWPHMEFFWKPKSTLHWFFALKGLIAKGTTWVPDDLIKRAALRGALELHKERLPAKSSKREFINSFGNGMLLRLWWRVYEREMLIMNHQHKDLLQTQRLVACEKANVEGDDDDCCPICFSVLNEDIRARERAMDPLVKFPTLNEPYGSNDSPERRAQRERYISFCLMQGGLVIDNVADATTQRETISHILKLGIEVTRLMDATCDSFEESTEEDYETYIGVYPHMTVSLTSCGHVYCRPCLTAWVERSAHLDIHPKCCRCTKDMAVGPNWKDIERWRWEELEENFEENFEEDLEEVLPPVPVQVPLQPEEVLPADPNGQARGILRRAVGAFHTVQDSFISRFPRPCQWIVCGMAAILVLQLAMPSFMGIGSLVYQRSRQHWELRGPRYIGGWRNFVHIVEDTAYVLEGIETILKLSGDNQ